MPNTLWFQHLSSARKPALQLFCFPYAGGHSEMFRRWQRQFPLQVDLVTVHLPGRGCRISEPFATEFGPLIRTLADLIGEEVQVAPGIRAPFAFYGHSMGAGISFELARELRRQHGIEPAHLFVSGRRAPQWLHEDAGLHNLSHDEFIATVRRMNGTPKELLESPEWTEVFLPLLRADFALIETYKYSPERPLSCAITAYCGTEDHSTPLGSVAPGKSRRPQSSRCMKFPETTFLFTVPAFPSCWRGTCSLCKPGAYKTGAPLNCK